MNKLCASAEQAVNIRPNDVQGEICSPRRTRAPQFFPVARREQGPGCKAVFCLSRVFGRSINYY